MNISPLELGGFVAIFSYSFFASLHCAFMCGPLVCAVLGPKAHARELPLWLSNFSRLAAYVMIGAILGWLGGSLIQLAGNTGWYLAIGIGSLLVLLGVATVAARPLSFAQFLKPPQKVYAAVAKTPAAWRSVALGGITSILPCMTLTPAYAMAAGSGSTSAGALFLMGFGLGTVPIMLLAPALAGSTIERIPKRWATIISGVFLMLAGAITVWRSFHFHG